MIARNFAHRRTFLSLAAIALLIASGSTASAADLGSIDSSLKLIPKDAAFYSSSMRLREMFDIVRNSNVWTKVENMQAVQMGLMAYQQQLGVPESGPAKLQLALQNPEVCKVVDLATDMVSNEMFVYGDDSVIKSLRLLQNIQSTMNFMPLTLQATGQVDADDYNQLQAKVLISALAENADLIGIPNVVVGFKVKNVDLAKEELIKLEMFGNLLETNEKTKGRFKKTKVGDHDYLVLSLDGELIPWDQIPLDDARAMELNDGDVDKIVEKVKTSKLTIALGLRDDYMLCSIGSSLSSLEKLGQGDLLVNSDSMKPLAAYADRRLIRVGYMCPDLHRQLNDQAKAIDDMLKMANQLLPLAKLPETQNKKILTDLDTLAKEIKESIPEIGAITCFQFLSDQGIEQFRYVWGKFNDVDGSKPLTLLQHVGGDPLLGVVGRSKANIENYNRMLKWATTFHGYFDQLVVPQMSENDREAYNDLAEDVIPLLLKLENANRNMLFPAMADGQIGFIVDTKLESNEFIAGLPGTEEPMPMIEPALVMGVSDAKLLKQALGEYRGVVNGLIDAVRKIKDAEVPAGLAIPEPETTESEAGTMYRFTLPEEWGVDKQIAPNIGVSNDAMVMSLSPAQTERLLTATPPAIGGLLSESEVGKPLAAVAWFNWAALVDAATPWVDYAIEKGAEEKQLDDSMRTMIGDQVHILLDVLKVVRSVTNETYLENDVLVNHTLLEIHDVEE